MIFEDTCSPRFLTARARTEVNRRQDVYVKLEMQSGSLALLKFWRWAERKHFCSLCTRPTKDIGQAHVSCSTGVVLLKHTYYKGAEEVGFHRLTLTTGTQVEVPALPPNPPNFTGCSVMHEYDVSMADTKLLTGLL